MAKRKLMNADDLDNEIAACDRAISALRASNALPLRIGQWPITDLMAVDYHLRRRHGLRMVREGLAYLDDLDAECGI